VFDANCHSREVLVHLTGKWNVLLLIALRDGTMRFAGLRRRVNGVGERMLARRLQQVEYTLTRLGHEAAKRVVGHDPFRAARGGR
jgi:DNA-binding HxlR family transcriptional regulator